MSVTPIGGNQANVEALAAQAVQLQTAGRLDEAVRAFQNVLALQANNAVALYSLAAILTNQGRFAEGLQFAERCFSAASNSNLAAYIYGVALKANGRRHEALIQLQRAVAIQPNYPEALLELGVVFYELGDFHQSLSQFEKILQIDPQNQAAIRNRDLLLSNLRVSQEQISELTLRGLNLQNAGQIEQAMAVFSEILKIHAGHFVALYSLAAMSLNRGELTSGLDYAQRCLANEPNSPFAWYILGCALKSNRRFEEALTHLTRALELNPAYKEAYIEKGIVYGELKDFVQALMQFNEVLKLDPEHKLAIVNLATSLTILKKHDDGAQFFERLLKIDPDHEYALGAMQHAMLHGCNWRDYHSLRDRIIAGVRAGKKICKSLAFLAISDDPADQLKCSEIFMNQAYGLKEEQFCTVKSYGHSKIRIGYLSPDFREHPVGHALAGVYEAHDKGQFEIYSFSLGVNDNSSLRSRFIAASDKFFDVRGKASREIALLIREAEIDILVDLAGPTMDAQPDVLAFRPAPIQVMYLGYPGTSGTPYIDYLLGDPVVTPSEDAAAFSEKVIQLPGCYFPADASVKISERTPSREEMGLPKEGFVFCSFNHDYKIGPDVFDVWMNILKRVEGSSLWLMRLNETAEANLRKEAAARGVDPGRLYFATRVPAIEDHLARYRLAGIFLDTTPYNAHTTASDALRSGLPVLTVRGHSFQSRVASSMVTTLGLPELCVADLREYEEFAVRIGSDPQFERALKDKLAGLVKTADLYDSTSMARKIENAYHQMWRERK